MCSEGNKTRERTNQATVDFAQWAQHSELDRDLKIQGYLFSYSLFTERGSKFEKGKTFAFEKYTMANK